MHKLEIRDGGLYLDGVMVKGVVNFKLREMVNKLARLDLNLLVESLQDLSNFTSYQDLIEPDSRARRVEKIVEQVCNEFTEREWKWMKESIDSGFSAMHQELERNEQMSNEHKEHTLRRVRSKVSTNGWG